MTPAKGWSEGLVTRLSLVPLCGLVLAGCVPMEFRIATEDPFAEPVEAIELGRTSRQEMRHLLGEPEYSSREWGVEIYRLTADSKRYLVYLVVLPASPLPMDEFMMVTYSESGTTVGLRTFAAFPCDYNCGGDVDVGEQRGLDFDPYFGKVLLGPRGESARLARMEAGPDECLLFAIGDHDPVPYARLYLDKRFVQASYHEGYFRLSLPPGEHTLACTERNQDHRPGHVLANTDTSMSEWTFSCPPGTTLYTRLGLELSSWYKGHWQCEVSQLGGTEGARELAGRRLIIPFDPIVE